MIKENKGLEDVTILKINESNFVKFCRIAVCLGLWIQAIILGEILMKYQKKQKWRTRSNFKCYESEKNIGNYVGKYKSLRKKRWKSFYGRIKNILAKSKSTPTISTSALSRTSTLKNVTPIKPNLHKRLITIKLRQFLG